MKKAVLTAALGLITIITSAQVATTRDSNGNFIAATKPRSESKPKDTGYNYTDSKGNVYPVYVTESGRYYVLRTSKNTGKTYKQYLK